MDGYLLTQTRTCRDRLDLKINDLASPTKARKAAAVKHSHPRGLTDLDCNLSDSSDLLDSCSNVESTSQMPLELKGHLFAVRTAITRLRKDEDDLHLVGLNQLS
jgi:hypothetical protein